MYSMWLSLRGELRKSPYSVHCVILFLSIIGILALGAAQVNSPSLICLLVVTGGVSIAGVCAGPRQKICILCRASRDGKFCPKCGKPLVWESECGDCGQEFTQQNYYCRQTGKIHAASYRHDVSADLHRSPLPTKSGIGARHSSTLDG